jgi:septum formation protein
MRILLASASPRRRELLESIGLHFDSASAPGLDEQSILARLLESLPERSIPAIASALEQLALQKGAAVAQRHPLALVISADTEVLLDGECLGKPADAEAAQQMLTRLSGRWHEVVTAVALRRGEPQFRQSAHQRTRVKFAPLDSAQIARYIERERPFDKAGGYAIQGRGALLIERIEGDYSNVVGLPLGLLAGLLQQAGIELL